jgi:hypothetical protein
MDTRVKQAQKCMKFFCQKNIAGSFITIQQAGVAYDVKR